LIEKGQETRAREKKNENKTGIGSDISNETRLLYSTKTKRGAYSIVYFSFFKYKKKTERI
jgi:hypothetical protein